MSSIFRHIWLVGPCRRDRRTLWNALRTEGTIYEVDCHQRLRGPYTGTGSLLRQLVPEVYQRQPDLVEAHAVEILSIAPELHRIITPPRETVTSLADSKERTRFYGPGRTLCLAQGIIDFFKACLSQGMYDHLTLYFERVQQAKSLDQELLSVLLRRADPATLTVVIGTDGEALPNKLQEALAKYAQPIEAEPPGKQNYFEYLRAHHLPVPWQNWLMNHSQGWESEVEQFCDLAIMLSMHAPEGENFIDGMRTLVKQASAEQQSAWARAYVAADGTSEVLLERLAYELIDISTRQQWHDERAGELEQIDQRTLALGAIPYHYEHGRTPAEKGAKILQAGVEYCSKMGYYEAVVEFGNRGRTVIDWETQPDYYRIFTFQVADALVSLKRPQESEDLYNEVCARLSDPKLHMQAAYGISMLYTRHHAIEKRNQMQARAWINRAIAIATLLPDPKERIFSTVFYKNALALIEYRQGFHENALQLVTEGMKCLDRELAPDEHKLQRSVLRYNRGRVYAEIGRIEEALADYTVVIEGDPYYSEYYFERGNLYRSVGRNEEALADYEHAIDYGLPYPEAYYNRGVMLLLFGKEDEALEVFNYVLELNPDYLDALVNRSGMLYEREEYDASREDVVHGLQLEPDNPDLLCTLGLLEMVEEHLEAAYQAFTTALTRNPSQVAAWTNRAILAFESGNIDEAIKDLTSALALEENATVFYNRGIAYQAIGSWSEAIEDFSRALAGGEDNIDDILSRREYCSLQAEQVTLHPR